MATKKQAWTKCFTKSWKKIEAAEKDTSENYAKQGISLSHVYTYREILTWGGANFARKFCQLCSFKQRIFNT